MAIHMHLDPAPGVDLAGAYADRMSVRVERDKIAEGEHLPTTATPTLGHAGTIDQPGRQTSPELAALASKYMAMSEIDFGLAVASLSSDHAKVVLKDVRRLAASVLSQVNG